MILLNNPLNNPIFIPTLIRLLFSLLAGFILVALLNAGTIKLIFKSEVWLRYKSWLVMAPIFMASIFFGGLFPVIFVFFVSILALKEFKKLSMLRSYYFHLSVILTAVTLIVTVFFTKFFFSLPIIYFLTINFFSIFENNHEKALSNVSYTLFANIWINFSLAHLLLMGMLENGQALLLMIGFSVAFSDIGAFCFGKLFKKLNILDQYKISPKLSPNKSYIGVTGNIVGALAGIAVMKFALPELSLAFLLPLGIVMGISDVLGDLTESMVKRTFGAKDSGTLIPGHGGILDRIDSLLRVIVVSYYLVVLFT